MTFGFPLKYLSSTLKTLRKANKTEESRQKRLVQQRENKRKNRASESVESRRKRLGIQTLYQKEKEMQKNLLDEDNTDWQTYISMRKKSMLVNLLNDVDDRKRQSNVSMKKSK